MHPWARAGASLLLLAVSMSPPPTHADRDIVFSAEHYRRTGKYIKGWLDDRPEPVLASKGPAHLYRINPDGTGLKQITFGKHADDLPCWSADGRYIAFIRRHGLFPTLWLADADGRHVRMLDDDPAGPWLQWSPTRNVLAVHGACGGGVQLFDIPKGTQLELEDANSCAWAPDGRRLLVTYGDKWSEKKPPFTTRIYDIDKRTSLPFPRPLASAVWVTEDEIVGVPSYASPGDAPSQIVLVNRNGRVKRAFEIPGDAFGMSAHEWWRRLPGKRTPLVFCGDFTISSGPVYPALVLDPAKGIRRVFEDQPIVGISPDGRSLAVAPFYWYGPIKRGGAKVGPLRILDIATGKSRAITTKLVRIDGGDWRRSSGSARGKRGAH